MFDGVIRHTAFGEIIAGFLSRGVGDQAGVPTLGDLLVDFEKAVFDELLLLVLRILFELERDASAFGEALDRFHEIERFVFADERENVPAFMAAVAMESLFAGIDVETGRAFAMKRAESGEAGAGALERDHRGNDIEDVISSANLFKSCWGD